MHHIFSRLALVVGGFLTKRDSCSANLLAVNWKSAVLDGMVAYLRRLDAEARVDCAPLEGRWKPLSSVAALRLSNSTAVYMLQTMHF